MLGLSINFLFTIGFYLHESGVLGASPDGLVTRGPSTFIHCEDKQTAAKVPQLLEVKCPYASRDLLIKDAVKSVKDFYLGKYIHYLCVHMNIIL